jgi:hypothetical protein
MPGLVTAIHALLSWQSEQKARMAGIQAFLGRPFSNGYAPAMRAKSSGRL